MDLTNGIKKAFLASVGAVARTDRRAGKSSESGT